MREREGKLLLRINSTSASSTRDTINPLNNSPLCNAPPELNGVAQDVFKNLELSAEIFRRVTGQGNPQRCLVSWSSLALEQKWNEL